MPRVVVAGLSGDSGKTLISLALLLLAHQQNIPAMAFKKGPDYIDAGWLSWASQRPTRNLDTFLMGPERTIQLFRANALANGLNLVEGNRGIFDGVDIHGTHSTAQLAKLLKAPILLVINATKVTHTVAALVLGCTKLDPEVRIGGVILNRVSGSRHESILRESVESIGGVPVLGVLPSVDSSSLLPTRHLGLVPPQEHEVVTVLRSKILSAVQGCLDTERIFELARSVLPETARVENTGRTEDGHGLKIAYLQDSAFSFYYPDNLEALEEAGAQLCPISSLTTSTLPEDLDALYIGGGFPETHAEVIASNSCFLSSIRAQALKGLPIYAECGGLMLLSRAIHWKGLRFPMAGVLPVEVEVRAKPQGHGYVELFVDSPNPYYPLGTRIRGHEFHYSKIMTTDSLPPTACAVHRGTGCFGGRDGILVENVWASYSHVHAAATREWARGVLAQARFFHRHKSNPHPSELLAWAGYGNRTSIS